MPLATILHVDGSTSNQLKISITNQTSAVLKFSRLHSVPSDTNANIILTIPSNQFYFYTAPTIDATDSTPGQWALVTDADAGGQVGGYDVSGQ